MPAMQNLYFKKFLENYDHEVWHQEMFNDKGCQNGNKLRTFRLHKDRLEIEPYVSGNLNRYERSVLAKLRKCMDHYH